MVTIKSLINTKMTPFDNTLEKIIKFEEYKINDNFSDFSEISDIFEEFHRNSYLTKQPNKKYLTKYEADVKTMNDFTEDFKNTMKNLKDELQIGKEPLCHDLMDKLKKIKFDRPKSPQKLIIVTPSSSSTSSHYCDNTYSTNSDNSGETFKSIVWELLKSDKFIITPPGYRTYTKINPHWLEAPPISWEIMENCRKKCLEWLTKYN